MLLAEGDLEDVGDEVGFDPVVLAEFLGRAGGVEVAQGDEFQAVDAVVPAQDLLEDELAISP